MNRALYEEMRNAAIQMYEKAHIVLTPQEEKEIEVADFGLGDVKNTGLESIVYVNTDRCCAKEMVLLPGQTCPEHMHPPVEAEEYPGKEETFRCRMGRVFLYVEGEASQNRRAKPPRGTEQYYTVFHEIILNPGDQYTMKPMTKHWFQADKEGAVISEFSTHCYDEYDIFTDVRIKRIPQIEE